MRIALLTDGIFPFVVGGMQRHSGYLASHLAARGHEVILVHAIPWNMPLPSDEKVNEALNIAPGIHVRSVPIHFPKPGVMPGHYLKESYMFSKWLADRLRDEWASVDFIYAKGFTAWQLLHEKSKGAALPPIGVKFHGYEMFQPNAGLRGRLEAMMLRGPVKWINRHADVVFSYGGKITPIIRSLGVENSHIIEISSGIEDAWIRNNEIQTGKEKRVFVFVGRNERRKGFQELHDAVASVKEDLELHIVGPFPHSVRVKDPRITYHGAITESDKLKSVLDAGHILILPSWSEGMPNVVLEAMARGLAVIATDVGAVGEMVSEKNGWLIEPGSYQSIAEAMLKALELSDNALNEKRRESLQLTETRFAWSAVAERLESSLIRFMKK